MRSLVTAFLYAASFLYIWGESALFSLHRYNLILFSLVEKKCISPKVPFPYLIFSMYDENYSPVKKKDRARRGGRKEFKKKRKLTFVEPQPLPKCFHN